MTPAEKFISEIAGELKTQPGYNIREEVFFPLRYAKNRPVAVQHRTIAEELMPQDPRLGPGNYAAGIGGVAQNVRRAIGNKYKEEMTEDGVDVNILVNGQTGQGGTEQGEQGGTEQGEQGGTKPKGRKKGQGVIWRLAYEWLWKHKYPRWLEANRQWLEANSWELLREKAKSPANWIRFLTNEEMANLQQGTRSLILPPPPALEPKIKPPVTVGIGQDIILPPPPVPKITPWIPANQSLWMVIDLKCIDYQAYQLLLLNKSEQAERLLCPSSAYAPNPILKEKLVLLPQKDSWAALDEEKTNFKFGQLVKEEFLAIVLEQPLNLPWLTPREEEGLIEWNGVRILDVFKQLENSGEWQVFYESFELV